MTPTYHLPHAFFGPTLNFELQPKSFFITLTPRALREEAKTPENLVIDWLAAWLPASLPDQCGPMWTEADAGDEPEDSRQWSVDDVEDDALVAIIGLGSEKGGWW